MAAQQLGFFDITDSSECSKSMSSGGPTWAQMLALGAARCCKSGEVDDTFCKFDNKCLSGATKCMAAYGEELQSVNAKVMDPRGMRKDSEGNSEGDCVVATKNRVEGALCCPVLRKMAPCMTKEVPDYTKCKAEFTKNFGPYFYDETDVIMNSFKSGGYCDATKTTFTTPKPPSATATPCKSKAEGEFRPDAM